VFLHLLLKSERDLIPVSRLNFPPILEESVGGTFMDIKKSYFKV
jgi:hypothetical protein